MTGCAATVEQITTPDGMIMLVAGENGDLRPDAALEGVLGWSAGGCLHLKGADDDYLLLMPSGTTLDGENTVVLDDSSRAEIGHPVVWGGGFYPSRDQTSGELATGLANLPENCLTTEIAVVNSLN